MTVTAELVVEALTCTGDATVVFAVGVENVTGIGITLMFSPLA